VQLLVCSRCFGVGGKGDVALLPMVDMLNHSANPHVVLGKATANDDNSTNKEAGLKKENPLPPPPPPVAAASANPLSSIAETEASTTSTSSSDNQTPLKRDFVAATSFEGNRPGFVFGTGPQGLGYYEDNALSKTATAAAGAVGSKGDSSSSEGTGFTLILAREVTDGEEVFSTYDKVFASLLLFAMDVCIHLTAYLICDVVRPSLLSAFCNQFLFEPLFFLLCVIGGHACGHFLAAELWFCSRRLLRGDRSCRSNFPSRGVCRCKVSERSKHTRWH